jgi:hypothetical protein
MYRIASIARVPVNEERVKECAVVMTRGGIMRERNSMRTHSGSSDAERR